MPTAKQFRKLALALPEVEEKAHFGNPDFRVGGKIFAGLSLNETRGYLKLTPEIQATLFGDDDSPFTPCEGAWGRSGSTYIDLATVDIHALEELMREAYQIVAAKMKKPKAKVKGKTKPKAKTKAKRAT